MRSMQEGYRFLEHTTDAFVEAWGPSLERAFAEAAKGLFETMIETENVDGKVEEPVRVTGHDEPELLYNWLEELLLRFELTAMVYSDFRVSPIARSPNELDLTATVKGEKYDRAKHGAKTEIKGVTYHLMKIERKPGEVRVRFLLDL